MDFIVKQQHHHNSNYQKSATSSTGGASNELTQRESSVCFNEVSRGDVRGHVAHFNIDEILKGNLHSSNRFTESFLIRGIKQTHIEKDPLVQYARDWLSGRLLRKSTTSEYRYVIKQIRHEFMHSHIEFEAAASYLANEATVMQMLRHHGIVGLYGTSVGNTEAYYINGGRHDAYFLIQDKIVETLEQRLDKWKGQSTRMKVYQIGGLLKLSHHERKFLSTRLNVAYDIADALEYMHRHNVTYRNFGMDKVGFNRKNETQLVDLGNAEKLEEPPQATTMHDILEGSTSLFETSSTRSFTCLNEASSNTESSIIIGAGGASLNKFNAYTAPEVIADEETISEKSVTFSFTMLLSEILTLIVMKATPSNKKTSAYIKEFQRISTLLPKELLEKMRRGASLTPKDRPCMQDFVDTLAFGRMSLVVGNKKDTRRSSSSSTSAPTTNLKTLTFTPRRRNAKSATTVRLLGKLEDDSAAFDVDGIYDRL